MATIIMVESINKIWVQFDNKEEYEIHSEDVPIRNKRSAHYVMPIYLYGIENKDMSEVTNKKKDKQYNAYILMNKRLKDHDVSAKCYDRDRREGIWVCSANVNGVDLGEEIILSGFSSFEKSEVSATPKVDQAYKLAESKAKEQKKGIWEPYYSLYF